MERLKFTRMDAYWRHIIVIKDEELKVIDHYSSYTRNRNRPESIFKGLKKLGLLPLFLEELRNGSRVLYGMERFTDKKSNSFKANKELLFSGEKTSVILDCYDAG